MLVIGSRGSQLALWQANHIQDKLRARGFETRIEIIKTTGDKITDVPLARVGSKGLFTKEIEEALLDGSIDLAVHSLKDLPTELPEGLTVAAVPLRADARDAIVGKKLQELPPGSSVGTSSLRRVAQLTRIRPDLKFESIRGNLDTRLRKLDEGQYQAIVLAAAGLTRLGWSERIADVFPPSVMCPAPGQGALGIETRLSGAGFDACAPLDHPWTRFAVTAEREMLAELGGGCQIPIGAFGEIDHNTLHLTGLVAAVDGSEIVRGTAEGDATRAKEIGRELGKALLQKGAARILEKTVGFD
ncbi:MAG TPA: hydroxymethylbilane synthase [Bryobacteraceae bacterium]